jgi:hypothetical protein
LLASTCLYLSLAYLSLPGLSLKIYQGLAIACYIFGFIHPSPVPKKPTIYLQLAMAPPRTNKESAERDILPLWMDQFRALKRFIKKHVRLPYKDENYALYTWIKTQRGSSKGRGRVRGLLQEERKLLESIGFFDFESRWNTPRITTTWLAKYKKLKRSNGNYIRDNAFRSWLISQRRQYRRCSLQPMKIKLLDDLPFDWMT